MLSTTLEIVRSALKGDPSIPPPDRSKLLSLLRNGGTQPEAKPAPETFNEPRLIKRKETARRLSCSLRTVDNLSRSGSLLKRKLPGRERASGFLASDVDALILATGKNGGQ
jgi:hypothetical protein